jgi:hypothetical protein
MDERIIQHPGGRAEWIYVCERCGERMHEQKCKIVCPNCGYLRDCGDP